MITIPLVGRFFTAPHRQHTILWPFDWQMSLTVRANNGGLGKCLGLANVELFEWISSAWRRSVNCVMADEAATDRVQSKPELALAATGSSLRRIRNVAFAAPQSISQPLPRAVNVR